MPQKTIVIREAVRTGSKLGQYAYPDKRNLTMAYNAKQVMDIRVSKGMTTAQSNEHQRRRSQKGEEYAMTKGNYDPTRERLNFEIVKGCKVAPVDKTRSIPERMTDILSSRGIKDPNEGLEEPKYRTVVNFIFGGSRERMHELAFGGQEVNLEHGSDNSHIRRDEAIERWAQDVYTFVAGKYGEENIVAFIVHLDELNPHVHCTLLPIKDGKFKYKEIFAGKDKYEFSARMKQLHSEFAEVNEVWGMSRGTSVSETGARHRTTEEYRRALSAECTTIEEEISQHKQVLSDLRSDIRLAERRVRGLNSMVENLKRIKAEKEEQLSELKLKLASRDGDITMLERQRDLLQRKIASIQDKLDDKREKLQTADQQLSALQEQMTAIEERTDELKAEAYKYSGDIQSRVDTLLKDVLIESLVGEHRGRMAGLSPAERELFDSSLLQRMAEQGNAVIHCATLLFVGLVDDATTFAKSHGGGGGGSDMKWGKDDDEDNRAWARRCMAMAARMMKPSSGRKAKR